MFGIYCILHYIIYFVLVNVWSYAITQIIPRRRKALRQMQSSCLAHQERFVNWSRYIKCGLREWKRVVFFLSCAAKNNSFFDEKTKKKSDRLEVDQDGFFNSAIIIYGSHPTAADC